MRRRSQIKTTRLRNKMDDDADDSKWTHNTSAAAEISRSSAATSQQRRQTAVNVSVTTAAGRAVPTIIILSTVSTPRLRAARIDAAKVPSGNNQEPTAGC